MWGEEVMMASMTVSPRQFYLIRVVIDNQSTLAEHECIPLATSMHVAYASMETKSPRMSNFLPHS